MAAGITAKDSMFYVRDVPWHGLGVRVENALTSEEAIRMAGLEWEVYSAPLKAHLEDGTILDISDRVANVRDSDKSILGVVSNRYKIVQNREAFAFTDALLGGSQHVRYETAGSLWGGKRVWMLAKMDGITLLGDKVDPYLVFTNSHDASTGVRVAITPIRVVCNNTLTMAVEGATRVWSTMHVGNISSKITEAQETLRKVSEYLEGMPEQAETMAETNIYLDETEQIFDKLFPVSDVEKAGKIRLENIERQKNAVYQIWTTTPDIAKFQGTAWGLYNAVADFCGHMRPLRETPTFQENRFASLADGHPLIQKAQEILMKVRQ